MDSASDAEKWDLNQERVFLENLMQTRFNFFLVVFGLWMVTVASITSKPSKLVFLGFGIVICFLLWLTIRRICQKVIAALSLLGADTKHPMKQVASAAGEDRFIKVTSNQLIGYIIPVLCISLFIFWFFYIAMSPAEKRVQFQNAVSFSSERTTKHFPSSQCASTIQIVRFCESKAETQPHLHPALLRLSAMISQYLKAGQDSASFVPHAEMTN